MKKLLSYPFYLECDSNNCYSITTNISGQRCVFTKPNSSYREAMACWLRLKRKYESRECDFEKDFKDEKYVALGGYVVHRKDITPKEQMDESDADIGTVLWKDDEAHEIAFLYNFTSSDEPVEFEYIASDVDEKYFEADIEDARLLKKFLSDARKNYEESEQHKLVYGE